MPTNSFILHTDNADRSVINSKKIDELLGLENGTTTSLIFKAIPWTGDCFNDHFARLSDNSYDLTEIGFNLFADAAKDSGLITDKNDQTIDDILIEFATESPRAMQKKTVIEIKNHTFAFHGIRVFETATGNYIALPDLTDILNVKIDAALQYQLSDVEQLHDFECGEDVDVIPLDMAVIEILLAKSKSPRVFKFREFLINTIILKMGGES